MNDELAKVILCIKQGIEKSTYPEDRSLAERYLSLLAPILAKATIGEDVLKDLESFDRFHGNVWLRDIEPFGGFYTHWQQFRDEYEKLSFSGMTVNERLFALDQIDNFDRYIKHKQWDQLSLLLKRVKLDDQSIDAIIKKYSS